MTGSLDRILERAAFLHQFDRTIEVAVFLLELLERPAPEGPFLRAAPAPSQHDRKADLAFAEVVADGFAKLRLHRRVVQHVVDELEGNSQIHAVALERLFLDPRTVGHHGTDARRSREQGGGLGPDDLQIILFAGRRVVRRHELHDFALGDHR